MQRSELSAAQTAYLDLVRAVGAALVLIGHAGQYLLPGSWVGNGIVQSLGVYLFFLISGFLISLSVLQKLPSPNYGFGDYFIDRFCRIYTAFLPALVLVAILDSLVVAEPLYGWHRDFNPQTWVGNLLMFQDYPVFQILRRLGFPDNPWFIAPFGSARPFWTISIEWWIYMLFGGITFIWWRRGGEIRPLAFAALALVAIEPLYHFVGGYGECLTMLWIVGAAASLLFHRLPALRARRAGFDGESLRRVGFIAAGVGLLLVVVRLFANHGKIYELQLGLYLALAVFGLFFALGSVAARRHGAPARLVGFLAGYSYSLYLTHHTVLEFVRDKLPGLAGSLSAFWTMLIVCNLFAVVFWWLFERHHRIIARWARARLAKQGAFASPAR